MTIRLSALNRKLFRDLMGMKGQALSIALVVAAGVAMYVMYQATFASLSETRRVYYERQRFGDVFASLKRAPQRVATEIAAIPGVSALETRVVSSVTLDLPELDEPAAARLVSIPSDRRPTVNDLFLRRGRWIEGNRPDEILASEGFVIANKLEIWRSSAGRHQWPTEKADDRWRRAVARVRLQHPTRGARARRSALRHLLDGPEGAGRRFRHGGRVQRRRARALTGCIERGGHRAARSHSRTVRRAGRHSARASALALDGAERVVAASEFRHPAAVDLPARRRVHPQRRADESAGAPAAADRLAQSPRLRQRGHRLALPEVGLRHRCRRHRHWRRCRRILRLDGHRPLQRLLPISRAELRRPTECRHRLCRVDILCCRSRHVRRRDARGAHPARRSDATRSTCAIQTHAARDAADLDGIWEPPGAWFSATSPVIHFGPRPPSLASPSRWPS